MSELDTHQWERELRVLLDQIQARPSWDWSEQRQRIAVLRNLIATRARKTEG